MTRRTLTFVPLLVAAVLASCSTKYGSSSASAPAPTTTAIPGAATPALTKASDLRAGLTYLLVEHAFLLAATTAPQGGPADAASALDANSHDVANLLAEGYGPTIGAQFYKLWTARTADLVAYTKNKAAKTQLATDDNTLAVYLNSVNQFMAVHTVTNPATGIGDELTNDDTAFMAMIDAQASADPATYTKIVAAAESMPHTAEVLAAAEAKLYPSVYPGTTTGSAADLRASFTALMIEHVELAAITGGTLAAGHPAGPASVALDNNSTELHNGISSMLGDVVAVQFSTLWAQQIDAYKQYVSDKAGAVAQLGSFSQGFGQFVSGVTQSKVSATSASQAIATQNAAMEAVIDASASGSSNVATATRAAAGAAPNWVATFTEAIAELQPLRYLP
jgi:hypothetical protein